MNEGSENQSQTTQDSVWQDNSAQGNNSFQDLYPSKNTTNSMGTYGAEVTESILSKQPVNMVTGIIGAFLGILVGMVLWIILYQVDIISGMAGFVMMLCAFKGFSMLGKGINKLGCVICIVMVLVAVYFTHNIALSIYIMREIGDLTFVQAYQSIPYLLKMSSEVSSAYGHDLAIGYVLTIVAIFPSIQKIVKNQ